MEEHFVMTGTMIPVGEGEIRMGTRVKVIIGMILGLLLIVPLGLAVMLYEQNFSQRLESYAPLGRSLDEFEGMNRERFTFASHRGQNLVGYKYFGETTDPRGVIVIAHGLGGGGHNSYLDIADYFTSHGYLVFAYDATGNDESEGDSVRGIPQGLIDLDYALRFVKGTPDFAGLPIMLFGHSWGAYSAGSVLNYHPDVQAVVMVAGFNEPGDVIREAGQQMMGKAVRLLMPFVSMYERMKFGEYANQTCIAGFENSAARVMIIHSVDDDTISSEASYDIFFRRYANNPRFQFLQFEDRGHNRIWYADHATAYRDAFNEEFAVYVSSIEEEFTPEIRAEYLERHLEKSLLYALDEEVMGRILSFYDESMR